MLRWDSTKNKACQILKVAKDGGCGVQAPIALLIHAATKAARSVSVPIAIHLNHTQDKSMIRYAADELPFDKLVSYCHARGIATEAEPSRIEGGGDGIADTADLDGTLTTPEQVEDYNNTGIDFLAPAFDNVHGEYNQRGPILDNDRLDQIRLAAAGRVRLVLHGTNDFPEDTMKRCIAGGIFKVNVNRLVLNDYLAYIRQNSHKLNLTSLMEQDVRHARKLVEWQMEVCGSVGKA
ncbi:fructose-bisphosphate aldolase [Dactylonectria estremocensis]|uniref:Fructose-bisphosphate aldolase n=1 Tax=Dactylonectria estremocensis TaxID=1079267 RepID=A0A9P9IEI1_9HYPO|nr:fructose-bisphosphate aldolase [Dactylonectria estremocensis]